MYTVIGLLRLGWITQYLSQPVISGFMSGACITIAMSQVGWATAAIRTWLASASKQFST